MPAETAATAPPPRRNRHTEVATSATVSPTVPCVVPFFGRVRRTRCRCCRTGLLLCFCVLVPSVTALALAGRRPAQLPFLDPGGRSREAQRSGFSPWKRSFCSSGQDRNGTVSCCGHRHRALIVRGFTNETCRWQRSGHRLQAAHSVADASGPRRAEAAKAGAGMVRWNRRKGQTKQAHGMVRWTDGRIKASWPRAWSVAPMEESNQAGARHGPLGPMEGSNGPLPGFGQLLGRSDPLRVPRIQGTASGQQDDRFGPA
jgi:hypothetical protein